MDQANDTLTVKAVLGSQVKRFDIKKTFKFTDLCSVMRGLFERGFDSIKYKDEDGDIITLSSEEEYEEAIRKVIPKTGGVLKLMLQSKEVNNSQNSKNKSGDEMKKNQTAGSKSKPEFKDDNRHEKQNSDVRNSKNAKKRNNGSNPVQYYTSLSAALKNMGEDSGSKVEDEPLKVFLPPEEVGGSDYQQNYWMIVNGEKPVDKLPTQDSNTVKDSAPDRIVDNQNETTSKKTENAKADTKPSVRRKKRNRGSRRSSTSCSSSSSSSSGSSSSGSDSDSSGTSSDSGSTSDSSKSSGNSDNEEIGEMQPAERKRLQGIRQRKRRETKMMARQLTHYIAPEVCDEVAHCMHHFKKGMKQSMAKKIAVTIEDTINRAFKQHLVQNNLQKEMNNGTDADIGATAPEEDLVHHMDITCDGCEEDIYGVRYKCGNCPDFDLCENCENIEGIHDKTHVFLKIRYPAVNAGRKNGTGHMRCLLKDNIYSHTSGTKNTKVTEYTVMESENIVVNNQSSNQNISEYSAPANEDVSCALKGLELAQCMQPLTTEEEFPIKEPESNTETKESNIDLLDCSTEILKGKTETLDVTAAVVSEASSEEPKLSCQYSFARIQKQDSHDDDIVVVKHEHASEFVQKSRTPDLVDFDAASMCSNGSEEFIVVPIPSYFDINAPLDEKTIREHRHSCKGDHSAQCCQVSSNSASAENQEKSAKLPVDLVASSLERKTRSQPDIAPVVNLMDTDVSVLDPPTDVIAKQPVIKSPDMPPLIPIINQPTAASVKPKMPEPVSREVPVIYSRGVAPREAKELGQEPSPLLIRDNTVDKKADHAKVSRETNRATPENNRMEEAVPMNINDKQAIAEATTMGDDVVRDGSRSFNRPAEKFMKQHNEYSESIKKERQSSTWSPEMSNTDDDGSMKHTLAGYLTDIVDATASAVTAVGGVVSNAIKVNSDEPNVHYHEQQARIVQSDGVAHDIHMPQETSARMPKDMIENRRPAMPAADVLQDMGFFDRAKNQRLLKKYQGDINQCVNELLSDNNWHLGRH